MAPPFKAPPELVSEHGKGQMIAVKAHVRKAPLTKKVATSTSVATGPPVDPIAAQVTAAQLPQTQNINNQAAASAAAAKQQAATTEGYYQALAGLLQGVGPATNAIYQNAAANTSAFGKGFSDGLAHVQSQTDAEGANAAGISGGLTPAPAGPSAADALYNLGGYIPASTMSREGAAFGAAADLYPATAAGQGAETIAGIGRQQALDQKGFQQQLADLAAQGTGLYGQFSAADAAHTLAVSKAHADEVYRTAMLDLQRIATTGYDRSTGKLTPKAQTEYDHVMNEIKVANDQVTIAQQNADSSTSRANTAAAKAQGYYVDAAGTRHPVAGYKQNADGTFSKTDSKFTPAQSVVSSVGQMRADGYTEGQIAKQLQKWHPDWSAAQIATTLKTAPKVFADLSKSQVGRLRAAVASFRTKRTFSPKDKTATVTIGGKTYKAGDDIPVQSRGDVLAYLVAQGYSRRDANAMLNRFYGRKK